MTYVVRTTCNMAVHVSHPLFPCTKKCIEAAYRFYKSKSEEESLQRSGKAESKKVLRRRHERITRVRDGFSMHAEAMEYPPTHTHTLFPIKVHVPFAVYNGCLLPLLVQCT